MQQQFISEPIEPIAGTSDATAMSRGEPGLPGRFRWRGQEHVVARVLSTWKTSTRDRGELYLRRHWFEVELADGPRMKLYCERQTKNRAKPKARWWVYTIENAQART